MPFPIRNARFTVGVPFFNSSGVPTDPVTPDTEFSLDAGAYADCVEEVTTIAGSNGSGYVTLTGAETNGSLLMVAFKVASGPLADLATLYPRNLPIISSGTLSAGSAGGGTLGTILAYDVTGCFIRTTGGAGGGGTGGANNQARRIVTYNMSTGAFTIGTNWETTPDSTTTYDVLLPEGMTLGSLKALNPASAGRTLVVDAAGLADANAVKLGPTGAGTAQTARDVGAALPAAAAGATGGLNPEVVFGGTASAGSATSLTLAGASAVDNFYNHMHVRILSGTGAGQERIIVAYAGATKVATVGRNWTTTPDNTSVYVLTGPETMASWNLFQGLASAGGATSVTITGGSATSSIYNGALAVIVAGTGARQARVITAYNGGTGVVTVDRAWQTNPDATSVILILAADLPGADGAGNLSGSVASVTGAVGSVTGAVGSVTGNVGGSTASVTGNVGGNVTGSVGSVIGAVGSVTGNVGGNVTGSVGSVVAAVTIAAASIAAIWDRLTSALTTVGSIGKLLVDNIDAAISSRLASASYTAPDNTSIATILTRTDVTTSTRASAAALATVQADTDDIQTRLPAALVGGRIDASVGSYPGNTAQTGDNFARLGAPTGASIAADLAEIEAETDGIGVDTAGVTTLLSRIASALTITGGKVDVNDKTGFALTAGEHTAIAADTQTGLTAQGYTTARAGFLDTLNGLVATIWAAGTRTLTAFSDSSGVTTLLARLTSGRATNLDNLDAAVSTRLATAGYTAPDNATIAAIAGFVDTEVGAIKTVTDHLDTALELDGGVYRFTTNALEQAPTGGSAPTVVQIRTEIDTNSTQLAAIKAKTNTIPASPAAVGSAMTLTAGERDAVADALLDRDMAAGADTSSPTKRTLRSAGRFLRNKWEVIAGVLTVYKENDTDVAWTSVLSVNASADPIIGSDPAG